MLFKFSRRNFGASIRAAHEFCLTFDFFMEFCPWLINFLAICELCFCCVFGNSILWCARFGFCCSRVWCARVFLVGSCILSFFIRFFCWIVVSYDVSSIPKLIMHEGVKSLSIALMDLESQSVQFTESTEARFQGLKDNFSGPNVSSKP